MSDDLLGGQGDNRLVATRYGYMLYNRHDTIVGRSLAYYGEYFEAEVALFRQLVRPGDVVVDVGANIGTHALALARLTGAGGRVQAWEPVRLNFQLLCANMALNSVTWADCHPAGLGTRDDTVHIRDVAMSEAGNYGGLALAELSGTVPVPIRRLDGAFSYDRLRLIKIDVEGMEAEVLRGAGGLIDRFRPALYVENDRRDKSRELILLLQDMGYACFWFLPPYHNPANFRGQATPLFGSGFAGEGQELHGMGMGIDLLCLPKRAAAAISGLLPVRDADEHPLDPADNPRFVAA